MPQVVSGTYLGVGVYDFVLTGTPDASSDPNVAGAQVGSTYRQIDGGTGTSFWVREPNGWAPK